jgi:superfamily II DNA or RNA helicase
VPAPTTSRPGGSPLPAPPDDPDDLIDWVEAHGVAARIDDVLIGANGAWGTCLYARGGEEVRTYRQLLIERLPPRPGQRHDREVEHSARQYLHRIASLATAQKERRAWLEEHGRDPDDEFLLRFLQRLRGEEQRLLGARTKGLRPLGTYEPGDVKVVVTPQPLLRYREWPLIAVHEYNTSGDGDPAPSDGHVAVMLRLVGWSEDPLHWTRSRHWTNRSGEVSNDHQLAAIEAFIGLVRDPERTADQDALADLLRVPAWQYALGSLDERLSLVDATFGDPPDQRAVERIAFRVTTVGDELTNVVPAIQKRGRGGAYSKGSKLAWYHLGERRDLGPMEKAAYHAHDDRFARRGFIEGGAATRAQMYGVLRALVDHQAVFLDLERTHEMDDRVSTVRLDIRVGRLRLRFASARDNSLEPQFDLLGVNLAAADLARLLRDDCHLLYLHRPDGAAPQALLAQVSPQAAAVVHALAQSPARFPPEAHDALATRLESLQETMDIEFPSQWTRSIAPADARLLIRLELLVSGALLLRMGVRPVKLGPVFLPGEGPALVLEGQGRDRHGARRDRQAERHAGHALAERLNLDKGHEQEPWCWRVGEGDPALDVVAALAKLGDEVTVEWADDARLLALGSVGRGDMRMKVGDRRDWFDVDGHAKVAGTVVRLADLLAAIREGRRYVMVGKRGFVAIEEKLREALARADGAIFASPDGALMQVARVGSDPLIGMVEDEAQIDASVAFTALRRRMKEGAAERPRLSEALAARLRPYQRAGVAWLTQLAHWGAGAILADEMGLGKTVQTLAVLSHRAALGPAIVIAPTSVVANWVEEAARFVPELRVVNHRGPDRATGLKRLGPGDLVVTSYALATMDAEALAKVHFASLVLDEAQAVKNATTERSKALQELDADWHLGLTGTPIENHVGEVWSIFRILSPGLLGSWEQFRARFAVPIGKFGDPQRRQVLAALLRPFVLRRTKAEVAPELPERTEIVRVVRLSPEEQALYEEMRRATLDELEARKKDPDRDAAEMRFELLAALTRMRQLCCHPRLVYPRTQAGSSKAAHLLELLDELREGDHRALVFSQFRGFLDLLAPRLRQQGFRVLVLDGTTPVDTRTQRIAAFQRGEADVFLISLKAGGFGLNLTAADTVIHLDPWWNPAVEDQATARAHRIGQTRPVTAVRLVAHGTIEEEVLSLHAEKRALAAAVLEGNDVAAQLRTDELIDLIRRGSVPPAP